MASALTPEDYRLACLETTTEQGLDPFIALLDVLGVDYEVTAGGGFGVTLRASLGDEGHLVMGYGIMEKHSVSYYDPCVFNPYDDEPMCECKYCVDSGGIVITTYWEEV